MLFHPVRLLALSTAVLSVPATRAAVEHGRIAGHVTDSTSGAPVANALVTVQGTSLHVSTDQKGGYTIDNVPVGTYTLKAQYIGYRPQAKAGVNVRANATAIVDFKLEQSALRLEAVVVTGVSKGARAERAYAAMGVVDAPVDMSGVHARFDTAEAWRYQRQPGNREQYDEIVENPFIAVAADPQIGRASCRERV